MYINIAKYLLSLNSFTNIIEVTDKEKRLIKIAIKYISNLKYEKIDRTIIHKKSVAPSLSQNLSYRYYPSFA